MDGKKKLEELVAGLDGVTPGPWRLRERIVDDTEYRAEVCGDIFVLMDFNGPAYPHQAANAAHIARCDPDTIRSISDAYKAMEAENERLRFVIEVAAEMAERPTYNELEVGFCHHPLRPDEIRQRLEDTCSYIAHDLRRSLAHTTGQEG